MMCAATRRSASARAAHYAVHCITRHFASAADCVLAAVAREPEAGVFLLAVQQRPKERFPVNRKEWSVPSAPFPLQSLQIHSLHLLSTASRVWWRRGRLGLGAWAIFGGH
jgi:hypothetical protein